MNFIKAKTALEIVEEYNKYALKRFMDQLNDSIEDAARCGKRILYFDPSALSISDGNFVCAFLVDQGYAVVKNTTAHGTEYKLLW